MSQMSNSDQLLGLEKKALYEVVGKEQKTSQQTSEDLTAVRKACCSSV